MLRIEKIHINHMRNDAHYQFFSDFRDAVITADCAKVKLDDWVSLLAAQNDALNKLVGDRVDEAVAKTDVVLREARLAGDEAFKKICDIINVYIMLEGAANYEVFVKTLNAIIAKYGVRHHHHGLNHDSQNLQDGQSI